ncbi:MAG TPA: hypothetical protein VE076_00305 [Nitrososphaeraceae archaeon]|nr:hypothetical protein [Nitrososphaeraceae archaeon]
MSSDFSLFCPYCENEYITTVFEASRYTTMKCDSCNESFNMFTVYQRFYEDIPLAKRLADIWIRAIYNDFRVVNSAGDVSVITNFLTRNDFHTLFPAIVRDCIIYGNSFIKYNHDQTGSLNLSRIDPALADISSFLGQYDYQLSITERDGSVLDPNHVIHFKVNMGIDPPFGDSIYGFWTHFWYPLKSFPELLLSSSSLTNAGSDPKTIEKLREIFEKEVIIGSDIPASLFTGDLNEGLSHIGVGLFKHAVEKRRSGRDSRKRNFSSSFGKEME